MKPIVFLITAVFFISTSSLMAQPPEWAGKGRGEEKSKEARKHGQRMREAAHERRDQRHYEREERLREQELESEELEDLREMREERYERGGSNTEDAVDTAVDSVLPEVMKDSATGDVIKEEAKKWWQR